MFPLCISQGCFPYAYDRRGQYKDVSLVLITVRRGQEKGVSLVLITRMFPL